MQLKAVVFDLDGTLYPYYKMYLYSVPFFFKYSHFLYNFSKVRSAIRHVPEIINFRDVQADLLAKRLSMPSGQVYQMIEKIIYYEWENVFKYITPFPSLFTILKKLRKLDLKLAVLSDYPVKNKLAYMGLGGLWDCALSSEETGYLKPHPHPFKIITGHLGVSAEEVLYVGDIYEYDVVGARNAGMKTAYFTPFINSRQKQSIKTADILFSNYSSFYDQLVKKFCFTKSIVI